MEFDIGIGILNCNWHLELELELFKICQMTYWKNLNTWNFKFNFNFKCKLFNAHDGMVPTKYHTTVHENNCAPCRLGTPPVETIVRQPTVHHVDSARPAGCDSAVHRYDCAPRSLNTVSVVKTGHRSFLHRNDSTRPIMGTCTNTSRHQNDWTRRRRFSSNGTRENSARS